MALHWGRVDISDMLMPDAMRAVSDALYIREMEVGAMAEAFGKVMVGDGR